MTRYSGSEVDKEEGGEEERNKENEEEAVEVLGADTAMRGTVTRTDMA